MPAPAAAESINLWLPPQCRDDAAFMIFAQRLIDDLNPQSPLEEVTVARHIEALWRLKPHLTADHSDSESTPAQFRARTNAEQSLARVESAWLRVRRLAELEARAQRSRQKAEQPRDRAAKRPSQAPQTPPQTRPEPRVGPRPCPDYQAPPEVPDEQPLRWETYIHFDPAINPEWPVFKGTSLPVENIVAMLLDGVPEPDLLKTYDFLNHTQIRAAQLCDAAGRCGPVEPG